MDTHTKAGQIVKFHTPLADENPDQQYVVLEWHDDADPPRAKIKALGTGLPYPPISVVPIADIVHVEPDNSGLIGIVAYILKDDSSKVLGRVVRVGDNKSNLGMDVMKEGVATGVIVTVIDNGGNEHSGILFVT